MEMEQAKVRAEFKATENRTAALEPFVPQKAFKPLTEATGVVLNTEIRSEHRAHYDQEVKNRETEREWEEELRKRQRQASEAEELKALRRSLVHEAQPIKQYPPITVKPSNRPATIPKSPVITTLSRTRSHRTQH